MKAANHFFLKTAFQAALQAKATSVMIYADCLDDLLFTGRFSRKLDIFLMSRKKKMEPNGESNHSLLHYCKAVIPLPRTPLSRIGALKLATTTALSLEYIHEGDKVVCVGGSPELGVLDYIQILDTGKEKEIIVSKYLAGITETIDPEVFQAVLLLTVELAQKGREGKAIGTIFVVGDSDQVLPLTKQMIINPFKGYDEEDRNIVSPSIKETLREFSALDGAFVVNAQGILLTAGAYLAAATEDSSLPIGLGARHLAAAGITSLTKAVAFVISESSGDVRIFKNGRVLTTIEKTI